MTNSIYLQAKEIQRLAGGILQNKENNPFTDVEEWKDVQNQLAIGINYLIQQEGSTPDEEGEAVLAILMGYTIAVRNRKNIGKAMLRAQEVLPKITDPVLKCRLTVFCYGECYDEELAQTAHQLIEEQKEGSRDPQLAAFFNFSISCLFLYPT